MGWLIFIALCTVIARFVWLNTEPLNHAKWVPDCNCEPEHVWAYRQAAKNLGLTISVRGPGPAPAGRGLCQGLRGIWVLRSQQPDLYKLSTERWRLEKERYGKQAF